MPPITDPGKGPGACPGTKAQQEQCYEAYIQRTFKGNADKITGKYRGASWVTIYRALADGAPNASPYAVYQATLAVYVDNSLGTVISGTIGGVGTTVGSINTGVIKGADALAPGSAAPSGGNAACALGDWQITLPLIGSFQAPCIISKTALRGLIGGLMIWTAAGVAFAGFAVLVVYGLNHTDAGKAVVGSAKAVAKVAPLAAV